MPLTSPRLPCAPVVWARRGGSPEQGRVCVRQRYCVLSSPRSRSAGEGLGVRAALTAPLPPPLPGWGEEGGRGEQGRFCGCQRYCVLSSPLSRSAGEGPGVRAALTSPPCPPPLPRCGRGGGDERSRGDSASVNDTVSSAHPSPAARERGRG